MCSKTLHPSLFSLCLLDVQYLADNAGKSPIVERRLQTSEMGVLEYTF
jgi:outer membrane scaffolding protein for murein synthesis (MipA/OmpV family)